MSVAASQLTQLCPTANPALIEAIVNGWPTAEDNGITTPLRIRHFFARVAVDPLRRSFIAYGVSGTPTIVLVDDEGVVRHRQVGYKAGDGLTVEGWRWAPGTSSP